MYVRTVNDQTLTFGVSGKLWRDAMVMYDRETNSTWAHVTGRAITGPLLDAQLDTYPALQTTWKAWLAAYPETKVLKKPVLYGSSYARYDADPRRQGIHGRRMSRSLLPAKSKVIGFQLEESPYAVPVQALLPGSLTEFSVADVPLLIFTDVAGEGVTLWQREYEQEVLDFTLVDKDQPRARTGDGRSFDLVTGEEAGGGPPLTRIQTTKAYWFGWHNFYPETQVVSP